MIIRDGGAVPGEVRGSMSIETASVPFEAKYGGSNGSLGLYIEMNSALIDSDGQPSTPSLHEASLVPSTSLPPAYFSEMAQHIVTHGQPESAPSGGEQLASR